jgi:hypothetical protein
VELSIVANHKATPVTDFPRRSIDFKNIDSLKYQYHLYPAKSFGTKFSNHTSITTPAPPTFVDLGSSWCQLSDGGSRDGVVKRYLALTRDAELVVTAAHGPKVYTAGKHAVVLVEHLADKTYRVSIPLADHSADGDEPKDTAGDPLDRTRRTSAADAT